MSYLPDVVAACPVGAAPNPPNVEPPRPALVLVVAVLNPNEGAAAVGACAPKPMKKLSFQVSQLNEKYYRQRDSLVAPNVD